MGSSSNAAMVVHEGWTDLDGDETDPSVEFGTALVESIAWFLDHPLCRVTSSTVVCESLEVATEMALPMPDLPRKKRTRPPPLVTAVAQWIEEALMGEREREDVGGDDARTLWFRHVDPLLQKSLGVVKGLSQAPLLRFSVEVETLFESRGLIWVRGQTCQSPDPVWILAGAHILLPKGDGIESNILLAVDSMPVVEFAQRAVSPGGLTRRV